MREGKANQTQGTHQAEQTPEMGLNWGTLAKAGAAVLVARAAERVLGRRKLAAAQDAPEQGRLGGEVAAMPASRAKELASPKWSANNERSITGTAKETPVGVWQIAKAVFGEFGKDNGSLMAAAVAFYLVLSVVPLVLVGIATVGFFMADPDAQTKVLEFTGRFMPGRSDVLQSMVISAREARQQLAGVGLAALLFTGLGGFSALETAINITWAAPNRNFLMNKVFALGMFLLVGSLVILSVGISSVVAWARNMPGASWLGDSSLAAVLGFVVPILISTAMFTFIFKFFPNRKVDWKPALISGAVTAALWEAFKYGYQWYSQSQFSNQEASYGIAAGFVGLILWIYYSSTLVLLGSELTWVLQGCPSSETKDINQNSKVDPAVEAEAVKAGRA